MRTAAGSGLSWPSATRWVTDRPAARAIRAGRSSTSQRELPGGNVDNTTCEITVPVGSDGPGILTEAVRRLDAEKIRLADIGLRRPSLDDVFLVLTGHTAEQTAEDGQGEQTDGKRRRGRKDR